MDKEEMFLDELNYIKDEALSEALLNIINMLPDYWFHEAASSTGTSPLEWRIHKGSG